MDEGSDKTDKTGTEKTESPPVPQNNSDNSSFYLNAGLGLGAYAATTTVLLGVACPVCVVAAPALIATGLYQKSKKKKAEEND